jgi:hypothetical protein
MVKYAYLMSKNKVGKNSLNKMLALKERNRLIMFLVLINYYDK